MRGSQIPPALLTSLYHSSFCNTRMSSLFRSGSVCRETREWQSKRTPKTIVLLIPVLSCCVLSGYQSFVQCRLKLTCIRPESTLDQPAWVQQSGHCGCENMREIHCDKYCTCALSVEAEYNWALSWLQGGLVCHRLWWFPVTLCCSSHAPIGSNTQADVLTCCFICPRIKHHFQDISSSSTCLNKSHLQPCRTEA